MIHNYTQKTIKNKKRVGRGYGSGKGGHTVGRGTKGAKSRTGYKLPRPGFEGGQMPLSRRLPKMKGFSRKYFQNKENTVLVKLEQLNVFQDGEEVNLESLSKVGIVKPSKKPQTVKILACGEITKKLIVSGVKLSKTTTAKINKAGGKVL